MEPVAGTCTVYGGRCGLQVNIQAAMEAPRFTKRTFAGCDVQLENRSSRKARDELKAKGHEIQVVGTFSSNVGGGQVTLRDFGTGVSYGASDQRKDGEAIAELGGRSERESDRSGQVLLQRSTDGCEQNSIAAEVTAGEEQPLTIRRPAKSGDSSGGEMSELVRASFDQWLLPQVGDSIACPEVLQRLSVG